MMNVHTLDTVIAIGANRLHMRDIADECRARANLYRLLAGAFAEEPGKEYLEALRDPGSMSSLAGMGCRFDEDFTASSLDELYDTLACEYAALFASPGGFPPVESVRLYGRYQQAPFYAVREAYRAAGFEVLKGRFAVLEDNLGVELLFTAALLDRAAMMADRYDEDGYRAVERDIRSFWMDHLGRWIRGYASLTEQAANHSFYREMARLLRVFAGDELVAMEMDVEDVDGGRLVVPKKEVPVAFNPDEPVCNACE